MNQYAASFDQVAPMLRLPLERWGGDAATRYNWQLDVYNSAKRLLLPDRSRTRNTGYPDVSEFNNTVERDRARRHVDDGDGADGGLDHEARACLRVQRREVRTAEGNRSLQPGLRQRRPPGRHEHRPRSRTTRASRSARSSLVSGCNTWCSRTAARAAAASRSTTSTTSRTTGSSCIATSTRTTPATTTSRISASATPPPSRDVDPDAKVTGPVGGGWMGFFFSPQDWRSGWNTGPDYVYYGNPVDRRAHGDIPFVEWYLQQFAAAEPSREPAAARLPRSARLHRAGRSAVQVRGRHRAPADAPRCRSRVLGSVVPRRRRHQRPAVSSCRACATGSRATTPAR